MGSAVSSQGVGGYEMGDADVQWGTGLGKESSEQLRAKDALCILMSV